LPCNTGSEAWQWTFLCVASVHTEQLGTPPLPAAAAALLDPSVQLRGPVTETYPDPEPLRQTAPQQLQARVWPAGRRGPAAARVRVRVRAPLAAPPAAAVRALLQLRVVVAQCRILLGVRPFAAA